MNTGNAFGFGNAFGQSQPAQSPFGAGAPASPFGAPAAPFGQQASSPFGGVSSTGMFGAQTQPAFGSTTPAFGASSLAFGATSSFGAKPFGGFGAATGGSVFGSSQPSFGLSAPAPAFGASSPAFGLSQPTPAFGASPALGAPGGFGNNTTTTFGAASAPAFGTTPPAFGASPSFGGGFGGGGFAVSNGTQVIPFTKTQDTDSSTSGGAKTTISFNHISAMKAYETKSPEELRWEDYQAGIRGQRAGDQQAVPGGAQQTSAPTFGATSGGSMFGGTSAYGAASSPFTATPAFGSAPAFGGGAFGASSAAFGSTAPTFGSTTSSPFGASSPFGTKTGGFGNNPAFGTASAPAFSQASSSLFGAASTPAFGGNAFGGFSQTSAAAAFGSTAPAFGASSAAFGISSAATPFGFNASSAAAFGAASTPAFSFSSAAAAGTTGSSLFGQSTPAFGFGTNTGSTFGGGGIFGANKPAFGAATPAFGAGGASFAASSPSLFGTPAQQPAGGAAGFSNLFAGGGAQTSPMFNFATPGQGQAFVTAQPTQAPGVATSPYGTLPAAPLVAQSQVEHKVGISQRQEGSAGSNFRPVAVMTPRSIAPRSGVRLRNPRLRFASRAAEPAADLTSNGNSGFADGGDKLQMRENPRRLFVRDPLPGTEPVSHSQNSPPTQREPQAESHMPQTADGHAGKAGQHGEARGHNSLYGDGSAQAQEESRVRRPLSDAEVSELLPKLEASSELSVQPTLAQLASMAREDAASLAEVTNFAVFLKGVGGIRWDEPVDVRGLHLDHVIRLSKGCVEVYLDENDKPELGQGLNKPATVTLEKVFKLDRDTLQPVRDAEAVAKFTRKLQRTVSEQGAQFISYHADTGEWKFKVEHFSRYGVLAESDSDEERSGNGAIGPSSGPHEKAAADASNGQMEGEAEAAEGNAQDGMLERQPTQLSVDDRGDSYGEWQRSDLTATLPARLQLDAATMLELRGTLFSGDEPASTQELRHAAYGSVSAAAPVPKQRKKVMHSWQRSVPRPPMGAAVPQPPLRRSLAATSHAPVEASAQSPSIPHRSLIDAGLLHGASTRVSWAAGGAFARVDGSRVELHRVSVMAASSHILGQTAADGAMDSLRQSWTASLEEQATWSSAETKPDAEMMLPKWSCQLGSKQEVEQLCERMTSLCTAPFAQDMHVWHDDPKAQRLRAWTWQLLGTAFGHMAGGSAHHGHEAPRLAHVQQRSRLNNWLKDFTKPAADTADRDASLHTILGMVSRQQLAAASALAAASGDVRLATLIAQAGMSKHATKALAQQIATWQAAGFSQHFGKRRYRMYQLLAGDIPRATAEMNLKWQAALCAHMGMGVAAALPVSNGVHAYDKAASAGLLPQPQPCYEGAVREDAETDACDISWRLIQLSAATESETAGTPQQTLTQLLRPAGYTPQRLDCLLAWQVLQVLMAIGAVPTTGQPSPQQVATLHMNVVMQLEAADALVWALFVAMHLPDPEARRAVVRGLVDRHGPACAVMSSRQRSLLASLNVPRAWVAASSATWAAYAGEHADQVCRLVSAGDWVEAHAVWLKQLATPLFNSGSRQTIEDMSLREFADACKPHFQTSSNSDWNAGGGLLGSYFAMLSAQDGSDAGTRLKAAISVAEQLQEVVSRQDAASKVHSAARSGLARSVLVDMSRDVAQELLLLGAPHQHLPPLSLTEVVQVSAVMADLMNMASMNIPNGPAAAGVGRLLLLGGAAVVGAINSLFNVEGGHRAIVFNRLTGIKDTVYEEGTHLMIPWFERAIIYDVRARPNVIQSTSGSRDLQMVNIGLRVLTRPIPAQLPEIYRTLGTDYAERVLPSIIQESLKSVIAQYNASQLLTMREVVSRDIRRILTQRARYFNIVLDDVSITQLTFSRDYTAAVESKQVAQQDAERAKFVVDKAEQDKQSAIIRAQGEATSAKLIGDAIQKNPAFLTLRKIEAARDIAGTIASSQNRVFLNADSLLLNLAEMDMVNTKG